VRNHTWVKGLDSCWRSWRSKFSTAKQSTVIDGYSDELSIANNFAAIFQSAWMSNSPARHDSLKAKFQAQFDGHRDEQSITVCTVEMVDACIRQVKRGKAAGNLLLLTYWLE